MFGLILILLLVGFVVAVLLAAGTLLLQGYLYSEPAGELYWRAPAAGAALMAFLGLWTALDYRTPGRFRGLFEQAVPEETRAYDELRVVRADGTKNGKEEVYKLRRNAQGQQEYRSVPDNKPLPTRPDKVIVVENGEKHVFEPERDAEGNFLVHKNSGRFGMSQPDDPLRYLDDRGLVMTEDYLGRLTTRYPGRQVFAVLLNLLHLGVWFAALWVLMRFQWPHALGLALALWGMTTLFVVPMVLDHAEAVARQRAVAAAPRSPTPGERSRAALTAAPWFPSGTPGASPR